MMNLDLEAAKASQEIIFETKSSKSKEIENLVTKTLGVLQENGVYACILYLYSLNKESASPEGITRKELLKITKLLGENPGNQDEAEDVLKFLTDNICNDLDNLILTKQLWEQTLIYARYGSKVREQ